MSSFVIGWTSNEQNERMREYMISMIDLDESFEFAIDTLILGFKQQIATGRWKLAAPVRAPASARKPAPPAKRRRRRA
jgi:hypothetical protein